MKPNHRHQAVPSDPEGEGALESAPVVDTETLEGSVVCPECNLRGPGIVSTEIPVQVYVAVIILLYAIGKWAFLIAPFLFLLINSQVRTCNNCGNIIEQKMQLSFKAVNESVYTVKFSGDLVIVISKRYAMVIGSVLLLGALSLFTYEEFFAASSKSEFDEDRFAKDRKDFYSWESYLEDCGSARIKQNEFRTDNIFKGKYKLTTVEWSGFFAGKDTVERNGLTISGLKVKMAPTDSEAYDIILDLSNLNVEELAALSNLQMGDGLRFKAVMGIIGNERIAHGMSANWVKISGEKTDPSKFEEIPLYTFKQNKRLFGKKL